MNALADRIAADTLLYTDCQVGQVLADSDCDLSDEESCVDALVRHSIRPWQFLGSLTLARVEAHNIRTLRSFWLPTQRTP